MHPLNDHTIMHMLKELGVYVTQNRVAVLKIFLQCPGAISVSRICKLSAIKLDRVSVYRTLQAFVDKNLILLVPNAQGKPHYILKANPGLAHQNGAAFFICASCGDSELLSDTVEINHNHLPGHHIVKTQYLVLEGFCQKCQHRHPPHSAS
jgi:Fur family ferric uptake transcriptional regulator